MPRTRSPIASVLLIAIVTCAMGSVAAVQQPRAEAPKHIEAKPTRALGQPESRAEGDETLQNAVASAVVGVLTEQFGGRRIAVKLDSTEAEIASIRDRVVSGEGRVQIGSDQEWIGFRYRTLYDTQEGSAGFPQVTLGGTRATAERTVPNDSGLVRELDRQVAAQLGREFVGQSVALKIDEVTTHETGKRYLRFDGAGLANFGREGSTPARIDALYDRAEKAWLRVNYELGPAAVLQDEHSIAGN
ncbi:hypothetical protein [Luteimonas vadosa]|uniref:TonB-dependent receptor n=1 Tax=Luteimonas vadosa TaxID=1165507 RepID=A0ABP9E1U1_9GAMM